MFNRSVWTFLINYMWQASTDQPPANWKAELRVSKEQTKK